MKPHGRIKTVLAAYLMTLLLAGCSANPGLHAKSVYLKHDRVDQLTDYILVYPKDTEAYRERGLAYELKGQDHLAINDYNKALLLNPHFQLAYWNRGLLYYKLNEQDNALRDLSKYLSYQPRSSTALLLRAVVYYKKGQLGKAIDGFKKVARLDRRYTGIAYINLATIYMEKKKYYRAWIYANKEEAMGVRFDPKNCFKTGRDLETAQPFMALNTHEGLIKKLRKT